MRSSTAVLIKGFTITPSLNLSYYDFEAGIYIWSSSSNCTITDCIIADFNGTNSGTTFGIELRGTRCTIRNNVITNNQYGIRSIVYGGDGDNIICQNTITNNQHYGIYCIHDNGKGNNIAQAYGNTIANSNYGVYFYKSLEDYSINNTFYHNNFIDNTYGHVYSNDCPQNWDNGYPSGGNYWSNYTGKDVHIGPDQDRPGSDGIGDTNHYIDAYNVDNYPLKGTPSKFDATSEYYVWTICNSSISNFRFNGTAISFDVAGENATTGFCRICIPTALMNDTYRVLVNGTKVDYVLLTDISNATHNYLYFTYDHSMQEVIIIPEFPSLTILSLFMIATLLAGIIYKSKTLDPPMQAVS